MAAPQVVLATRNSHKVVEVRRILASTHAAIDLIPMPDSVPDVVETGSTFAGNATLKAEAVSHATGLPAIADDSGLCVDALNGMPGVLSARWAGKHGDDAANLDLVLAQLADVPIVRRGAQFVCVAALAAPGFRTVVSEGVVMGALIHERRGDGGFGYDPIFIAEGHEVTTAQMAPEQKDAISHRGAAMRGLAAALASLPQGGTSQP